MNFRTKPRIKAAIQKAASLARLDDSSFTMQAAYQAARSGISARSTQAVRGYGFQPLPSHLSKLLLPLKAIRQLMMQL